MPVFRVITTIIFLIYRINIFSNLASHLLLPNLSSYFWIAEQTGFFIKKKILKYTCQFWERDKNIERGRKMRRKRRKGGREEGIKKERSSDTIRLIWRMNITDTGRLGQDLFFKPQKPWYQLTHPTGYNWEFNEEKLSEKSCHVNVLFISICQ